MYYAPIRPARVLALATLSTEFLQNQQSRRYQVQGVERPVLQVFGLHLSRFGENRGLSGCLCVEKRGGIES